MCISIHAFEDSIRPSIILLSLFLSLFRFITPIRNQGILKKSEEALTTINEGHFNPRVGTSRFLVAAEANTSAGPLLQLAPPSKRHCNTPSHRELFFEKDGDRQLLGAREHTARRLRDAKV
jgi:hypothetical protein